MTGARRRTARGAAVAAAVLLGGMIPGAQAASGVQEIDAELAYTCDFPEAGQPVKATISATVPESGRAEQVIQPEDVGLDLTLPEEASAGLAAAGAATVTAEAKLSVDVVQGDQHARTEWIGTTAEPVPVPGSGDLTLSTAGGVPFVKPAAPGDLVFGAGALSVELALTKADGTPADSPALTLGCALDTGQEATLATVPVGGDGEETGAEPTPTGSWPEEREAGEEDGLPEVGTPAQQPAAADAPPCLGDPSDDLSMVAFVTGYANVAKLDGATRFPLACARITQGESRVVPDGAFLHIYQDSAVDLDFEGKTQLPPASGTFLTFGFMPTTATLEMTQIPPGTNPDGTRVPNIKSDLAINLAEGSTKGVTAVTLELMLRLRDVEVDGVPLDVGDNCRTSKPFTLKLEGHMTLKDGVQVGYTLATGGELTGSVTLPPFSGCGADEDLDNLFTASLSGVPGYVKQVQGAPCAPANGADPTFCMPDFTPRDVPEAAR
ncbi:MULTISPECIES: DUF6801 domain-containing protein [Streptomyces]|uniref:DUF6801 domain-containing protein n=1 Tax=Streptomyces TaxID=1883 RepID=UPI001F23B4AA|nr:MULTISPECIES: DUF6801 domain-containing protein [Streptomyces]